LPEALESTGYRFSSSISANSTLTHLPFRLNYGRTYDTETNIFEFPITIEDEKPPLMNKRVDRALKVAELISEYNGIFNILIHPNVLDHKYEFQKEFIKKTRDKYWYGSVSDFGRWWSARDSIETNITEEGNNLVIELNSDIEFYDIALVVTKGYKINKKKSPEAELHNNRIVINGKFKNYKLYLVK
jgi:hypothetical protein